MSTATTKPDQLIREGRVDDALAAMKECVRRKPEDAATRLMLFNGLCLVGDWNRALTQIRVVAELDAGQLMLARMLEQVVACEMFRSEVFAGKRSPLVLGEPPEWMGGWVKANELTAAGKTAEAQLLRATALEQVDEVPGRLNDRPFQWIGDSDSRLGPVLEIIVDGRYYWTPFTRIHYLRIEQPKSLRQLIWAEATITWTNEGQSMALIPVRYPGTETGSDALRLSRQTEWQQAADDTWLGLGQRMLMTDDGEVALLEVRNLDLDVSVPGPGMGESGDVDQP